MFTVLPNFEKLSYDSFWLGYYWTIDMIAYMILFRLVFWAKKLLLKIDSIDQHRFSMQSN